MFDDRGASEVVGYVIIFSIVIFSVLLLSASGTTTLEDIRDDEQAENAERALDIVADNMAEIYERDSPSRATEIDVKGSQLFYGNHTTIELELLEGGTVEESFEEQLRPIVLRSSSSTELIYEGGAVFRTDRDGGTMIRDPPLLLSTGRVHAPIVKTTVPELQAVSGTSILLRGKSTGRDVLFTPDTLSSGPDQLRLNVTSPRFEIWERYFEEETPLTCTTDPNNMAVECEMAVGDTVYVTLQEIELSIVL
jgi:hypothetical protein